MSASGSIVVRPHSETEQVSINAKSDDCDLDRVWKNCFVQEQATYDMQCEKSHKLSTLKNYVYERISRRSKATERYTKIDTVYKSIHLEFDVSTAIATFDHYVIAR
jgi:hypothetical protein